METLRSYCRKPLRALRDIPNAGQGKLGGAWKLLIKKLRLSELHLSESFGSRLCLQMGKVGRGFEEVRKRAPSSSTLYSDSKSER